MNTQPVADRIRSKMNGLRSAYFPQIVVFFLSLIPCRCNLGRDAKVVGALSCYESTIFGEPFLLTCKENVGMIKLCLSRRYGGLIPSKMIHKTKRARKEGGGARISHLIFCQFRLGSGDELLKPWLS